MRPYAASPPPSAAPPRRRRVHRPDRLANHHDFLPRIQKVHKIRITLTSRKVQALEKVCSDLIERAKTKELRAKGPVRLPTKTLKITVRRLSLLFYVQED